MVVDFHAHILPGADHGSNGRDTTQAQLRLIAAGGTDAVVATPHFYPHKDNLASFLARRTRAIATLKDCQIPEDLQIFVGAEVQVCEGLEDMEELDALCVQGTRTVLLEMPFVRWSDRLIETVVAIGERGYTPVLAHIDRYPRKSVELLLKKGIAAQLNAEPFGHFFARRRLRRYLEQDAVVALGSDLHGAEENGYAHFLSMRERLGVRAAQIFDRTAVLLRHAIELRNL